MSEGFDREARRVVVHAQLHARRLGHHYVGCEHLLLAATSSDEPAGVILRAHGLTPDGVEELIVQRAGLGAAGPASEPPPWLAELPGRYRATGPQPPPYIPFTPGAKKTLQRTHQEALALRDSSAGVQHIVLALTTASTGPVPPILSAAGTTTAALRTVILDRYRQAS